jgi:hypothetical protein
LSGYLNWERVSTLLELKDRELGDLVLNRDLPVYQTRHGEGGSITGGDISRDPRGSARCI